MTRKTLAALAALLFLFSAWPTAAAADAPSLILMEVCPATPVEFVRLVNSGMETMDLSGWSVGDGEGSITFSKGMALAAGDSLILASNSTVAASFFDAALIDYRDPRLQRQGTFQLANDGDQVFLRTPQGLVVDMLVYGDAGTTAPWIGKPLRTIAKNSDALRVDASKWSASAWTISVPGRSDLSPGYFDGSGGVFTAPEAAEEEVMAFIAAARTSLVLCTYQFEHPGITTLLAEKARTGVNVSLLVEGEPVAGIGDSSVSQLHFLEEAGVNVSIMTALEGYRRYDFVHAKYIVADSRRLLVMSENLVDEALQHNRGWGAVLESPEAAAFILQMFAADVDYRKGDVLPVGQAFERTKTFSAGSSVLHFSKLEMVQCRLRFAISPETSLETLLSLVTSSRSRLLMEEMQADFEDMDSLGLAPALVEAAAKGVQVRVLLDSSLDKKDGENQHFVQSIGPGVEARLASDDHMFTVIHNKGIISDDSVLVSSINL
ncbi:MAG: phospholipase D-like domain-containing protein, partial [Methanomassiliicoccales archaeon]